MPKARAAKVVTVAALSEKQALKLLAAATMRPFTRLDWDAFAGCESDDPLIGESGPYLLVVDDNTLVVYADQEHTADPNGVVFQGALGSTS